MAIPKLPNKMPKLPKPKKKFKLTTLGGNNRGKKIIVYGGPGMGKTTLCSLLSNSAFISNDGGADEILHPITGEHLQGVNVESFQETRNVLHSDTFDNCDTVIHDNITLSQQHALSATFDRVPKPKQQGGGRAENIEAYGFHKGYRHWYDTMLLLLPDYDRLTRMGKNVVLIAWESIHKSVQTDVEDFVKLGPELYHSKDISTMNTFVGWADHIFRISYANMTVEGGKATPVKERQVQVHGDATFIAKSRTIPAKYDIVEFKEPADDSIWRLLFGGE